MDCSDYNYEYTLSINGGKTLPTWITLNSTDRSVSVNTDLAVLGSYEVLYTFSYYQVGPGAAN